MSTADVNAALRAHYGTTPLVFGTGPVPCAAMLIGEAPGAHEVEEGTPFCGQAGRNLSELLDTVHLQRSQLYITNVCKFRPTKMGASGRLSNRTPTTKEVSAATPFLLDEISCVQPRLIVTLGNTALQAIVGSKAVHVGEVHGTCISSQRPVLEGICIFALYHPASILYNRSLRRVYEEDLVRLSEMPAIETARQTVIAQTS